MFSILEFIVYNQVSTKTLTFKDIMDYKEYDKYDYLVIESQ